MLWRHRWFKFSSNSVYSSNYVVTYGQSNRVRYMHVCLIPWCREHACYHSLMLGTPRVCGNGVTPQWTPNHRRPQACVSISKRFQGKGGGALAVASAAVTPCSAGHDSLIKECWRRVHRGEVLISSMLNCIFCSTLYNGDGSVTVIRLMSCHARYNINELSLKVVHALQYLYCSAALAKCRHVDLVHHVVAGHRYIYGHIYGDIGLDFETCFLWSCAYVHCVIITIMWVQCLCLMHKLMHKLL